MVVQETTNAILNMTILSSTLSPFVLFVGLRTQLANRLATNGADWASYFAPYNSGTYNNEFQIVDLKQFQQFQAPQTGDGLLFIVSQIPSDIRSADMSDFLAHELYWASYNRPFFPDQYSKMGYDYWNNTYPAYFSYAHDPRANIFRREQQRVSTLEDMQHVMTFNQWQTDPFSLGNAGESIAARYDLIVGPNPVPVNNWFTAGPSGAIDAKITSAKNMLAPESSCCQSSIICGPTHVDQPPFSWNGPYSNQLHVGQPDLFDFQWVNVNLH